MFTPVNDSMYRKPSRREWRISMTINALLLIVVLLLAGCGEKFSPTDLNVIDQVDSAQCPEKCEIGIWIREDGNQRIWLHTQGGPQGEFWLNRPIKSGYIFKALKGLRCTRDQPCRPSIYVSDSGLSFLVIQGIHGRKSVHFSIAD